MIIICTRWTKTFCATGRCRLWSRRLSSMKTFLVEGADGKYLFNPSYSPENHPKNNPNQACINATMEVMGANGLFRAIIEASRILGVNEEKIPVWQSMLAKMPVYLSRIENGEIREWLWGRLAR